MTVDRTIVVAMLTLILPKDDTLYRSAPHHNTAPHHTVCTIVTTPGSAWIALFLLSSHKISRECCLHCSVMLHNATHHTLLHTTPQQNSLRLIALNHTTPHFTPPHYTTPPFTPSHHTTLYSITPHFAPFHQDILHTSTPQFTPQHFAPQHHTSLYLTHTHHS